MKTILRMLGLIPTEEDVKLKQLVDSTYDSVRVAGRGTVRIDPKEIGCAPEFKDARKRVKDMFEGNE